MEEKPLTLAQNKAVLAEEFQKANNYKRAKEMHCQAAKAFTEVLGITQSVSTVRTLHAIIAMHQGKVKILELKEKSEEKMKKLKKLKESRPKKRDRGEEQVSIEVTKIQEMEKTIKMLKKTIRNQQEQVRSALELSVRKIERVADKLESIVNPSVKSFILKYGKQYSEIEGNPFAKEALAHVIDINELKERINELSSFTKKLRLAFKDMKEKVLAIEILSGPVEELEDEKEKEIEEYQKERENFSGHRSRLMSMPVISSNDLSSGWDIATSMDTVNLANGLSKDAELYAQISRQHTEEVKYKRKKMEEQRSENQELRTRLNAYWKKIEMLEEQNRGKEKELAERDAMIKTMKAKIDNSKIIIKKLDKEGKYLAKRSK